MFAKRKIRLFLLFVSLSVVGVHAEPSASFQSLVEWDYSQRKKLRGWKNTAAVISQTLQIWYPDLVVGSSLENQTPQVTREFLSRSVSTGSKIQITYLAAHQSPAAEWEFPDRSRLPWREMLPSSPVTGERILLLDACFAASVLEQSSWKKVFPFPALLASSGSEETFELNYSTRRPLDIESRFPQSHRWLRQHLPAGEDRLSFFGLIWLETFLKASRSPQNREEWVAFLRDCQKNATRFQEETSRRWASNLILFIPE